MGTAIKRFVVRLLWSQQAADFVNLEELLENTEFTLTWLLVAVPYRLWSTPLQG